MVWSILVVLIIIVVLKGVFNTTVRDNPDSGYKELQNRLKNIIEIQKETGLYVTFNEQNNRAHGIYFIGDRIGYIGGEDLVNASPEVSILELIKKVKSKRLEIRSFRFLWECNISQYQNNDNRISVKMERNLAPNDLAYFYIDVEVLTSQSIKCTVQKDTINSPYTSDSWKKTLVLDQIFNYREF